jgi:hypothetical protein
MILIILTLAWTVPCCAILIVISSDLGGGLVLCLADPFFAAELKVEFNARIHAIYHDQSWASVHPFRSNFPLTQTV